MSRLPIQIPKRHVLGCCFALMASAQLQAASSIEELSQLVESTQDKQQAKQLLLAQGTARQQWPVADQAQYWMLLAMVQEGLSELAEAKAAYNQAEILLRSLPAPTPALVTTLLERSYITYLQTYDTKQYCPDRENAVTVARQVNQPDLTAKALTQYAFCFNEQPENFAKGLAVLEEAMEIADANQLTPNRKGMIYNATGLLYRKAMVLDKAYDHLQKAYAQWALVADTQDMFNMQYSMLGIALQRGDNNQAQDHIDKMFALASSAPEFKDFLFFAHLGQGTLHLQNKQFSEAIAAFRQAQQQEDRTDERFFVLTNRSYLAKALFRQGEIKAAGQLALSLIEEPDFANLPQEQRLVLNSLAAHHQGQHPAALNALFDLLSNEEDNRREFLQLTLLNSAERHDDRVAIFEKQLLENQIQIQQLQLQAQEQARRTTRWYLILLSALALSLCALAVTLLRSRARFRLRAQTDYLTGIANRRHLFDVARIVLQRAARRNEPVSLLVFDIDHFKQINDSYGHDIGDSAIRQVVSAAQPVSRKQDLLARLGGEEFALLLPGADLHHAAEIAERLRKQVHDKPLIVDKEQRPITVSIGVSSLPTGHGSLESLLNEADKALYQAKTAGRNRVVTIAPELV